MLKDKTALIKNLERKLSLKTLTNKELKQVNGGIEITIEPV